MTAFSMITPETANTMIKDSNGLLIDVRSVGEALVEHLPGSLYLPFDLVNKERLKGLGLEDRTPILVCRSGVRAKQAAEALAREMDEVAVLDGGLVRWKETGLPTTQGRRSIPLDRQVLVGAGSMMMLFTILGLLLSPIFFVLNIFMAGGMIFAGATGACGMARVLVMMPWNKAPLCEGSCAVPENVTT
jgi:rhodanese-related sulfurtransferase